MKWMRILAVLTIALLVGSQAKVFAQGGGMSSGGGGGTGMSSGGSSMFGSSGGGSGTPSASNLFGNNTTNSSSNLKANNAGNTSTVGVGGQAQTSSNGGFIGANASTNTNQQTQNFVGGGNLQGATQTGNGMNGGMGGMGSTGMGGMNGMNNGMGGQGNNPNSAQTTTPAVRIVMSLGFPHPALARLPEETSLALAGHLGALPALHLSSPVQVEMRGHRAILRGVVATEHDRDLAERVARLEATVDQVENQLVVEGQSAPPTTQVSDNLTALPARPERSPASDYNSARGSFEVGSLAPDSNSAVDSSAVDSSGPAPLLPPVPFGKVPPPPAPEPGAK